MSRKVMDALLSRWFIDGRFRQQLRDDPEQALADYDLSPTYRTRLLKLKKQATHSAESIPTQRSNSLSLIK